MKKGIEDDDYSKFVKLYLDYMVDVAVIFGADRERANLELKDALDFKNALLKVSYIYKGLYNLR